MTTDREKMSSVDKAWLQMESADNLMMITAVLIFESAIELAQLRTILAQRLLHYERFKQKVVSEDSDVYWQDDAHFDMDNHLTVIGLPGAGDQTALQQLASDISNLPLDFHKPLWHMYFVDRYRGGWALIVRMHHCIADGISLVRVLLSITDDSPADVRPLIVKTNSEPAHDWLSPARQLWQSAYHFGHDAVEEGIELFQHPEHLLELAQKGLEIGSELSHIGLMQADTQSCLKRPLSGRKQVAWSEPLSLEAVKATARNLGGTVNDVLVCSAAGALHRYLRQQAQVHQQEFAADAILRLVVPVNLRPLEVPIVTLGNQFGLIMVDLPIGEIDAKARFAKVKANLIRQKQSQQAQVFYGMLSVLGKGPSRLEQFALEILSKNASAVMTNVPGPKRPVFLAGSRLVQPIVWVPQSGQVGVGLSILSYDGIVQFGIIADKAQVADPNRVVRYFAEHYRELETLIPLNSL